MPRGDGTGPMGLGPRTGGGFGYCSRHTNPRGRWLFGRQEGLVTTASYPGNLEDEVSSLKDYAQGLQEELKYIQEKIASMEKPKKSKK